MAHKDSDTKSKSDSESMLGAVSIKLPPFWRNDPEVWFAQAEAQFATRNITAESTKYSHVIATLPTEVAQDVRDILINPPSTDPYTTLRKKLIARTTESEQRRVQMLLTEEELGDRKPSQLLRRMVQLVGDQQLDKGILKQLFLQRLPQNVRLILASTSESLSLSDLADLADRIIEVHVPVVSAVTPATVAGSHVAAVRPAAAPAGDSAQTPRADLVGQIADLTKLVRELATTVGHMQRARSRSRSRSKSKTRKKRDSTPVGEPAEDTGLCWYHDRYGNNAHHCRPPCTWNAQGNE